MTEHIKGEWNWSKKIDSTEGLAITTNGCVFATVEGNDKEAEAKAQFITAAPDLLAVCKHFCNEMSKQVQERQIDARFLPLWNDAKNAIAKANNGKKEAKPITTPYIRAMDLK